MTGTTTTSRTGSIVSTVRRALKPWRPPILDGPMILDAAELRPLGKIGGVDYFDHKLGELKPRPRRMTESNLTGDGPFTVERIDGERVYTAYDIVAPGTYQAAVDYVAENQPAKPRAWPVDALAGMKILRLADSRGMAGAYYIRGCRPIRSRLKDKGIEYRKAGTSVVLWAPGGDSRLIHDAMRLMPFLAPYVLTEDEPGGVGIEPDCFGGCGRKATTLAWAWPEPLPWCGRCDGERAA